MIKKAVFTSKNMHHQRYRKTEEAILRAFFTAKQDSTMKKLAKEAGIGRSTIYTHHHAIREIVPDYEKYILTEYRTTMRKSLRAKTPPKTLYLNTLLFIIRNRKIFKMFVKFNDRKILFKMLEILRPHIEASAHFPRNSEKIFKIYASETTEIIFEWGEHGFPDDKLEKVLSDIIYLTDTSRSHLMPIN